MSKILKAFQVNIGNSFSVEAPVYEGNSENIPDICDAQIMSEQLLENEVEKILQQADAAAKDIIMRAEQDAESVKEKAKQEGFDEGKREYENIIAEAEQVKEKALVEYKKILEGAEQDIIDLVLRISAKILGNEVEIDRGKIVHVVSEALKKCVVTDIVVIRVSPEDYEILNQNMDKLKSCSPGIKNIDIKADPGFSKGKCVIETQFGSMEAGIDVQLEQIRDAFKQLLI